MSEDNDGMRLAIRIDGREPMRGVVESSDQTARPFVGWLGLLKVLEGSLAADTGRPTT